MWTRKRICRIAVLTVMIALTVIALDQRLIVHRYTVESDKISAPVRLAVISDFHGCDYGEGAKRLIAAVEAESPDAVLLVGDIFDDALPWDDSEALVRSLAAQYPCYYVTGNHEYWSGEGDEICQIVESCGASVLHGESHLLTLNGVSIRMCGVPDPEVGGNAYAWLECAASEGGEEFTVLLAHRPELIEQYAATGAFDLVVSGHAHGGQVRVPGFMNGLFAPNQGFLPKYAGGLYEVNGMIMIVSRGLARESTRLPRIFNRPELVVVELK